MQTTEIVLLAIAALIGVLLFMRVIRTVVRVVFLVAVLGAIYYFWSGRTVVEGVDVGVETLFQNTTITELMSKYCPPDQIETMRCKCAIIPANEDFKARFTPDEISALQNNRPKLVAETAVSLNNIRGEMSKCFEEKKEKAISIFQKMRDLYNLINQ